MADHYGLNPAYPSQMAARLEAQNYNHGAKAANLLARATNPKAPVLAMTPVPKQPNKYVPHYGAKEAAKYAGRGAL